MGLDMYLYREHKQTKSTQDIKYWRKANQIHGWFVREVQDGVDDCGEYEVSFEQLMKLLNTCKEVVSFKKKLIEVEGVADDLTSGLDISLNIDKAEALLPPTGGFFFGSTEINEGYLEDLVETIDRLKDLTDDQNEDWVYYYQSSW